MFHHSNKSKKQKLKCDHIFVFNKYYIKKYQNSINSKYHVLGNYKNNIIKISKTKFKGSFLYISHYHKLLAYRDGLIKSLNLLDLYFLKIDKKINILLRSKNPTDLKKEINYYKKLFKSVCIFHKSTSWDKSYKIVDKYENIIFSDSHLGYEAISRKKKIAVLPLNKKNRFAWPAPFKQNYNFFCAKKLTYIETERVLNNVFNCKQSDWNKKYYTDIKDVAYFDKNNSKLKKVISELL
jgi:surface carbohydrate biosynthesis protein